MSQPFTVRANPAVDPDGSRVNAVLAAYLAAERARDVRALAVHAMAALSVPLVARSLWPAFVGSADFFWLLRGGWLVAVAGAAIAFGVEWRYRLAAQWGATGLRPPAP